MSENDILCLRKTIQEICEKAHEAVMEAYIHSHPQAYGQPKAYTDIASGFEKMLNSLL